FFNINNHGRILGRNSLNPTGFGVSLQTIQECTASGASHPLAYFFTFCTYLLPRVLHQFCDGSNQYNHFGYQHTYNHSWSKTRASWNTEFRAVHNYNLDLNPLSQQRFKFRYPRTFIDG